MSSERILRKKRRLKRLEAKAIEILKALEREKDKTKAKAKSMPKEKCIACFH